MKKHHLCTVKGCPFEGRYCRKHLGYEVPVKQEVKQVSDKKKELDKQYKKVRAQFLREHPFCQANLPDVCSKVATQVHHKRGKIGEADYLNPAYFLAVCHGCHAVIERNPSFARQQGFSISRHAKQNAA